jgi:NADPH2:quinone reductase
MGRVKAMVYRRTGGPDVIQPEELDIPEPGPGELLVRVAVSGVNPTDWKTRTGGGPGAPPEPAGWQVPNQDGAGLVVGVGNGVDPVRMHERVWLGESAYRRPWGTAAEYTVVPARKAVLLGTAPYEVGAALGVPFVTAHRCLTVGEYLPDRVDPGSLTGRTVLVQGGAGAVGNAAVQLARWADATVIATVSSPEKAQLAAAAGASHVVNYRQQDVAAEVRKIVPDGVDVVVEVDPATNAATDAAVLGPNGSVAMYAATADQTMTMPIRPLMVLNARWQFVLLYTMPEHAKVAAAEDVSAAVVDGAVGIGRESGLPIHRFPLSDTAGAHAAVEAGAVGKVLVTVDEDPPARVG